MPSFAYMSQICLQSWQCSSFCICSSTVSATLLKCEVVLTHIRRSWNSGITTGCWLLNTPWSKEYRAHFIPDFSPMGFVNWNMLKTPPYPLKDRKWHTAQHRSNYSLANLRKNGVKAPESLCTCFDHLKCMARRNLCEKLWEKIRPHNINAHASMTAAL